MKVKITCEKISDGLKVLFEIDPKIIKFFKENSKNSFQNIGYFQAYNLFMIENYPNFVYNCLNRNHSYLMYGGFPNLNNLLCTPSYNPYIIYKGLFSQNMIDEYLNKSAKYIKLLIEEVINPYYETKKYLTKKESELKDCYVINKEGYSKHWYSYYKNYKKHILPPIEVNK